MASVMEAAPGSVRILNPHERVRFRETYGDIPSLIEAAREETAECNLGNAWHLYEQALAAELLRRWVEFSNKRGTPIRDIPTLKRKLASALLIDRWTSDAIEVVTHRPSDIGWRHLDTIAALVTGLCLENNKGASHVAHDARVAPAH